MADTDVTAASDGNYRVTIDNDNNATTKKFRVKDGAGSAVFDVNESGVIEVYGEIQNLDAPIQFDNTDASSTTIIQFMRGTSTLFYITNGGRGVFNTVGVKLPVVTTNPDSTRSSYRGEVIVYNSGTYHLCVNTTSGTGTSTSWKKFACS